MSANEVLQELSKIGRADMVDFIRAFACGDPVTALDKLTPAHTRALGEVTVDKFTDGAGEDAREVRRIRFKLIPKIHALELFGKHYKLYVERHQHEGAGIAERLAAALARVDGEGVQESENESADDKVRAPAARGPHRRARKAGRKGKRTQRRRERE